jgi:glutamate racemase
MGLQAGAIGIFDSGVGGLTVFRRLAEYVPGESIIYLGDTARVPYGTKSAGTVVRYARACANLLLDRGVKMLVVACNTASAYAIDALRAELDVPVLGVIEPGAAVAVRSTRNKRVGVIGTAGTVSSGQYERAIHLLAPDVEVFSKPCPLFVPLAEEGWTEGDVPRQVAREYLGELAERRIDTLVLGCTHYPLLKGVIAEMMGKGVTLVDSAEATAAVARDMLGVGSAAGNGSPSYRFLVSDAPESFARVGKRFLGCEVEHVEWVDC